MGARAQTAPVSSPAPPVAPNLLEALVSGLLAPPPPPPPAAVPAPAPAPASAVAPVAPPPAPARPAPAPAPAVSKARTAAVRTYVPRTGPRSTVALLEALRALEGIGITRQDAAVMGMGSFPVGGLARYRDDWMEPRYTPTPHPHWGTDVFAARGTPVRAPTDGVVRFTNEATGGKSAYVTSADKTFYYMTHLEGFNKRLRSGQRVIRGDVVGYVGSTGNASGGTPHLHFEVHPRGGGPVNPKPYLDQWMDEALTGIPALVAERTPVPPATPVPAPVTGPGPPATLAESVSALAAALLLPLTPAPIGGLVATAPA